MFCTNCGKRIERPQKYCPFCGMALEQGAGEQAVYTPVGYVPTQPKPCAPAQWAADTGTVRQPVKPNKRRKGRGLSIGARIGITAIGAAVLALLVYLGISLLGKGTKADGAKPDLKAAGGVWSGVMRFDKYFPEDGTVSALVYASDDGILPCILNVEKGGKKAELVVKDTIIQLAAEEKEYTLQFKGCMADETITLDVNIHAGGLVSLYGTGLVIVEGENIPLSLRLTRQSDEAPILGSGGSTLPKPPARITSSNTAEVPSAAQAEYALIDSSGWEYIPQSEAEPLSLAQVLPGTWVTNPDQDFGVSIFAFDKTGLMCHGLASSEGETALEGWGDESIWTLGDMTWRSWTLDGDIVSMSSGYNTDRVRIVPKNEEWIVAYYEDSEEGYEFHRMGEAPGLDDYMAGTWVPDRADENGIHAVLLLAYGGSAVVTSAKGVTGAETPADWGNEGRWDMFDTKEGTWRIESGGNVSFHLNDRDSTYIISIQGPDSVALSHGSNWETVYTRVH